MKSTSIKLLLLSLLTAVLFTGCENGYDCSLENVAYNRIGFYRTNSNGIDSSYTFPEVLTVSLMVNGRDSIVVNHIKDAEGLQLPMSYTSECDTVIFAYEGDVRDTLYFDHTNIPYYISMECGTVMYHRLTGIRHTGSFIDSAAIVNDYINFNYNENVKLYLFD